MDERVNTRLELICIDNGSNVLLRLRLAMKDNSTNIRNLGPNKGKCHVLLNWHLYLYANVIHQINIQL